MSETESELVTEAIAAPPVLEPFVRRLLRTWSTGPVHQSIHLPRTGGIFITFVSGAAFDIAFADAAPKSTPRLFVGGVLRDTSPRADFRGDVGLVGAEFTATGFHRLFRVDCSRLTDAMTPLVLLLPDNAPGLERELEQHRDRPEAVHALECFLLKRVADAAPPGLVDDATDLIDSHRGQLRVAEVASRCGVDRRRLHRAFLRCVGVGPKHYSKVVQVRQVLDALEVDDTAALQMLAHDAGYYDQAHFVQDFRRLIGPNPQAFQRHADSFLKTYIRRHVPGHHGPAGTQ